MSKFEPIFSYHPTLAPDGKRFTDEAEFNALGPEWVDTPTKFPPPDELPVEEFARVTEPDGGMVISGLPPGDVIPVESVRRGRKAKETVQ